jgi:hypothetical protein
VDVDAVRRGTPFVSPIVAGGIAVSTAIRGYLRWYPRDVRWPLLVYTLPAQPHEVDDAPLGAR